MYAITIHISMESDMYLTERASALNRDDARKPPAWRPFAAVLRFFATYHHKQRERAQLLALTEHELRDIGITRIDAIRAAEKPLWG
jgi:uncharacterized protein YjiS (DUF1127 family)